MRGRRLVVGGGGRWKASWHLDMTFHYDQSNEMSEYIRMLRRIMFEIDWRCVVRQPCCVGFGFVVVVDVVVVVLVLVCMYAADNGSSSPFSVLSPPSWSVRGCISCRNVEDAKRFRLDSVTLTVFFRGWFAGRACVILQVVKRSDCLHNLFNPSATMRPELLFHIASKDSKGCSVHCILISSTCSSTYFIKYLVKSTIW